VPPRSSLFDHVTSGTLAVDVGLVSAVALLLGLIRLGAPSFWVDEAFTALRTEQSYAELVEGYHWLYQTIVNTWAIAAGTSEWALRFPSVLGAMLACALVVVLGRMVFDRGAALVSGLLLATSPFLLKWSQQARGYTLLVALSLLATVLLLRALGHGSRRAWALYGLAFASVVVWHPVAGAVLVPAHVVLMAQRRGRLLPHALLAALIVVALGGVWAGQIIERSTGEGFQGVDWLKAPSPETAALTFLDVSGAAGIGALLAAVGLAVLWRAGRSDLALWLGTWAIAPFALTLMALPLKPLFLDRYLVTAAPAFALLGGVALVTLSRWWRVVALALVICATAVGLARWYTTADHGGNWRGEDWRGAVEFVNQQRSPGEPVLVVPWVVWQAAAYYGAEGVTASPAKSVWAVTWAEVPGELGVKERAILRETGRRLVERHQFGKRITVERWAR
jgi:mannosyltransferase